MQFSNKMAATKSNFELGSKLCNLLVKDWLMRVFVYNFCESKIPMSWGDMNSNQESDAFLKMAPQASKNEEMICCWGDLRVF